MSDLRSAVQESWSRAVLAASSVEEQAEELIARLGQAFQESPLSPEGALVIGRRAGIHNREAIKIAGAEYRRIWH